jgi:LuxR family maltose regulon positive regulatory protein
MEFCKSLFDRSSFYHKLDAALRDRKMVYVSAQAGWGKTIAMAAWVRAHGSASLRSARALPFPETILKKSSVLVIDDLQELSDGELQERLLPLITGVSGKQYVLIGRAELPPPLCTFALTGLLAVLDERALCLTRDEVDSYLAEAGLPYSVETSTFLTKESKGYPIAVDCLAEQLKNGAPCTETTVRKATQAIFDYFEQVVFCRFSQAAQAFLLQIAPFPEFTLRMAVAVSGEDDIVRVLDELTHRGKCIHGTAPERYAVPYFFHRFLLYYQKRKCSVEATDEVWRRAGLYYESCDDIPNALHCYQQVNDWDKLVELLIRHTRRPPYTTYYFKLKEYYLALPSALVEQSPELMCSLSMIYSMNMRQEESEYWYDRLERFSRSRSKNDPARTTAMERLAFLRIGLPHRGSRRIAQTILDVLTLMQGEGQCIQCISPTSGVPSVMHGAKDFCNWSKRDEQLYRVLKKPIETLLGRAGIGVADAGLAESKLERCTLSSMTEVMIHATSAISQAEQAGTLDVYFAASVSMMRLSVMQGDSASAHRNLDNAEKKAAKEGNARLLSNIRAFRIRLFLLEGNTAEINRWMQEAAPDELGEFQLLNRYQYMVKARCYILKGEYLEANALLMRMLPYFEMSEQRYCLMEARMLLAIAQYRMDQEHWDEPLTLALDDMERYGFIRLPAEEGTALLPLLTAVKSERPNKFRQTVEREASRYAKLYPHYLQPPNQPAQPLTQTEKQVLHLLNQGMKNAEIAQSLHVSVRTVKFHTSNIFAKLNVKSRTEAIALSRKLFE